MASVIEDQPRQTSPVALLSPSLKSQRPLAKRTSWTPALIASAMLLGIIALLLMAPFIFMISTSFNGAARTSIPFPPQIIPAQPSTEAYRIAILQISLWRLYANTFEVEVVEIVLSLSSALLAGYALSKIR